jgi:hypothetical protein
LSLTNSDVSNSAASKSDFGFEPIAARTRSKTAKCTDIINIVRVQKFPEDYSGTHNKIVWFCDECITFMQQQEAHRDKISQMNKAQLHCDKCTIEMHAKALGMMYDCGHTVELIKRHLFHENILCPECCVLLYYSDSIEYRSKDGKIKGQYFKYYPRTFNQENNYPRLSELQYKEVLSHIKNDKMRCYKCMRARFFLMCSCYFCRHIFNVEVLINSTLDEIAAFLKIRTAVGSYKFKCTDIFDCANLKLYFQLFILRNESVIHNRKDYELYFALQSGLDLPGPRICSHRECENNKYCMHTYVNSLGEEDCTAVELNNTPSVQIQYLVKCKICRTVIANTVESGLCPHCLKNKNGGDCLRVLDFSDSDEFLSEFSDNSEDISGEFESEETSDDEDYYVSAGEVHFEGKNYNILSGYKKCISAIAPLPKESKINAVCRSVSRNYFASPVVSSFENCNAKRRKRYISHFNNKNVDKLSINAINLLTNANTPAVILKPKSSSKPVKKKSYCPLNKFRKHEFLRPIDDLVLEEIKGKPFCRFCGEFQAEKAKKKVADNKPATAITL